MPEAPPSVGSAIVAQSVGIKKILLLSISEAFLVTEVSFMFSERPFK